MSAFTVGLIGVIIFFVLLAFRIPIAFTMIIVGFAGFAFLVSPAVAWGMLSREIFSTFSSYSLSVIPMFIWMGFLAYYTGIGSRLYHFAYRMMGHYPGGLAMATQGACAVFGAVCGSNTATAA